MKISPIQKVWSLKCQCTNETANTENKKNWHKNQELRILKNNGIEMKDPG